MPAQMLAGAGRHEANHQLPPPAPPPITTTSRALSFSSCCVHGPHPLRSPGPSPEATDAGKRVGMEAKKKSGPSAAAGAGAGAAPPLPNGYFSTVFPSSPAGNAKDAKQTDLYVMLNKQSARGQNGSSITDSKSHGCTTYKDGKHIYPNESESPYFGSSVHYGGREFYSSPQQKQPVNEPPRDYKEDNPDGSATRGDWWQGSLYY